MEGYVFHFVQRSQICSWCLSLQNSWNIWPPRWGRGWSVQEQASYCWVFGCSCTVFRLTGCVCLPGKQYLTGLHPGTIGWPGVHGQNLGSWWESITCERYGGLQVQRGHWTSTSKCRWGKIRCPHGCSYQDSALIYCKQSLTPVSQCINHMV